MSFKVYFKYGTMASGKTAELLMTAYKYEQKGVQTLFLSPKQNTRDDNKIKARIGLEHGVDLFVDKFDDKLKMMLKWAYLNDVVIFVDEAQFINQDVTNQMCVYCRSLELSHEVETHNFNILAYGLMTNFQGHIFTGTLAWLEQSDSIHEVKSICDFCERKAYKHILVSDNKDSEIQIEGDNAKYYSVCQYHYLIKNDLVLKNI